MLRAMPRFRVAAVSLAVLVPVAGCTSGNSVDGTPHDTAAAAATTTTSTTTTAPTEPATSLAFPVAGEGEIARSTFVSGALRPGAAENAPEPGTEHIVVAEPVPGHTYVVDTACVAGSQSATVGYRVRYAAQPGSASDGSDPQFISAGELPCDGQPYRNSVGPLTGPVIVEFDTIPATVYGSYAVVVPG
ncbi:MAG: hypothetical protein JWQ45_820 [Blastococcus sp.]|nr:hypothetical protein [Blastococcus sp.]